MSDAAPYDPFPPTLKTPSDSPSASAMLAALLCDYRFVLAHSLLPSAWHLAF